MLRAVGDDCILDFVETQGVIENLRAALVLHWRIIFQGNTDLKLEILKLEESSYVKPKVVTQTGNQVL